MNYHTRLLSIGMIALLFSCKGTRDPEFELTPRPAVTLDDIVGTYTGTQKHHKIDYAYGMGQTYSRDTTYTTIDTLIVEKIGSDSFTLSHASAWAVYGKPLRFAFDTSNVYIMGDPGTGGGRDTIAIRFDIAADSMVIEKYEFSPGTSAYHIYDNTFRGKK